MSAHALKDNADALLLSFLRASDQTEEDTLLTQLITDYANPVITRTVLGKLQFNLSRSGARKDDLDELLSEVRSLLLRRLRLIKSGSAPKAIENFESYVAAVTRHACDDYLRRSAPRRSGLKDRVRYQLAHHGQFALWKDAKDSWLAGLSGWADRDAPASPAQFEGRGSSLMDAACVGLREVDIYRLGLDDLLLNVLHSLGRPVELNLLVNLIAELWGIDDTPARSTETEGGGRLDELASQDADPDTVMAQRQLLGRLWREICLLPRRQRQALLLNLRNPQGINVITLLPATEVATFEQLARALEMSEEELERVWVALPMDDLSIGEYIGANRQQVINLRKNARERLRRRMQAFERGDAA